MVVRREMADRIGGACIAGECEGLAAAAAGIDVAASAALARLRQEARAAEGVEGGVGFPDVPQRMVFYRAEIDAPERVCRVSRQNTSRPRHTGRAAEPTGRRAHGGAA